MRSLFDKVSYRYAEVSMSLSPWMTMAAVYQQFVHPCPLMIHDSHDVAQCENISFNSDAFTAYVVHQCSDSNLLKKVFKK